MAMRMRIACSALIVVLALGVTGCRISRHIRDLPPVTRPPLPELESHLTYTDPDDGRPDYIFQR